MIELTEEQRQAVQHDYPPRLVDPRTRETYVLVRETEYDPRSGKTARQPEEPSPEIAPGILASQRAFWRDLPELLLVRKYQGQWVAYHHDERIGIAKKTSDLYRELQRRGIPGGEYYLGIIQPRDLAPWEPEEIEPDRPREYEEVE